MISLLADLTVTFLGGGNMAASLIGGLLAAGHPAARLRVVVRSEDSAARVRLRFGIDAGTDPVAAVAGAEVVVLAVKPQQAGDVLRGLSLAPGTLLISVAAGLRLATIARWLGDQVHLVRTMPNTPALYGAGITGAYAAAVPAEIQARADALLRSAGEVCWVNEEAQIDAVTAVSGSGPAYFFLLTEILAEAGATLGLDPDTAQRLARQTAIGAATMLRESDVDAATLRAQVTSKGGTTEAAVESLETAGLRASFKAALSAAVARAQLRGDELAAQA